MEHISYAFQIPDSRARSARQKYSPYSTRVNSTKATKPLLEARWQLARNPKATPDWHKTKSTEPLSSAPQKRGPEVVTPVAPSPAQLPGLIAAEFSPLSHTPRHTHSILTTFSPSFPFFKLHCPQWRANSPVWTIYFLTWISSPFSIPALPIIYSPTSKMVSWALAPLPHLHQGELCKPQTFISLLKTPQISEVANLPTLESFRPLSPYTHSALLLELAISHVPPGRLHSTSPPLEAFPDFSRAPEPLQHSLGP